MFPPCINKYYILDLQPENSLVRYAVEQGHPVFMVSWRNITEELGRLTWDDYIERGVLKALEVARVICALKRSTRSAFASWDDARRRARGHGREGRQSRRERDFPRLDARFSPTRATSAFHRQSSVAMRERRSQGRHHARPRSRARVLGASRERPRLVIRGQQLSEG